MSNEYVTVSIPRELIEQIDKLVGKSGFSSRAEIVKAALRRLLQDYKEV